ncbi:nuclear transport factor 2 family protein [Granulicoccus sp. GXG6511]|uniref:nuclear transport factor 2 family protein n=1 Tax=Granulicoccus sp. GXG6511 TaxID=3381351 RepID=UPI003D7C9C0E
MTAPHADPAEVVRDFWAAQIVGDRPAAEALLAPDLDWRVMGRTHSCARTFRGPDGFFGELIAMLGAAFVPGTRTMEVTNVFADGDQVLSEFSQSATSVTGHEFALDIACIMRVEDGLITTCREYMDLAEVTAAIPD